jgi:hypothetical protein
MLPLISQASRQQFIKQSFPTCMRMQGGLPPFGPRVVVRDQRSNQGMERPDAKSLAQLVAELKAKSVKPMELSVARTMPSTSTILPPSKIIHISEAELSKFDNNRYFEGRRLQFPVGVIGDDRYEEGRVKAQMRKFGDEPFSNVVQGLYDQRGLKELLVLTVRPVEAPELDSEPVEEIAGQFCSETVVIKLPKLRDELVVAIAREMDPCQNNRGIVGHPDIAPLAFLGGEVWFLPDEEAVHFNLNSGRFPAQSDEDLYAVAIMLLSMGYKKVFATPRDQRYGEVTPLLFMKEAKPEVKSEVNSEVKSEAKPQSKHLEFA